MTGPATTAGNGVWGAQPRPFGLLDGMRNSQLELFQDSLCASNVELVSVLGN